MQIKIVNGLSKEHWDFLTNNNPYAFPREGHEMQWQDSQWHVVALNEQQMPIANIGFVGVNLQTGEQSKHVVGVGGVIVKPEFRGQHLPAKLFDTLHQSSLALSISKTFTLFCPFRLEDYYARVGYRSLNVLVEFMQNGKMTHSTDFTFMHYGDLLPECPVNISTLPW